MVNAIKLAQPPRTCDRNFLQATIAECVAHLMRPGWQRAFKPPTAEATSSAQSGALPLCSGTSILNHTYGCSQAEAGAKQDQAHHSCTQSYTYTIHTIPTHILQFATTPTSAHKLSHLKLSTLLLNSHSFTRLLKSHTWCSYTPSWSCTPPQTVLPGKLAHTRLLYTAAQLQTILPKPKASHFPPTYTAAMQLETPSWQIHSSCEPSLTTVLQQVACGLGLQLLKAQQSAACSPSRLRRKACTQLPFSAEAHKIRTCYFRRSLSASPCPKVIPSANSCTTALQTSGVPLLHFLALRPSLAASPALHSHKHCTSTAAASQRQHINTHK